jgi:hypothetical protein
MHFEVVLVLDFFLLQLSPEALLAKQAQFQQWVMSAIMDLRESNAKIASQLQSTKDTISTCMESSTSKKTMRNTKGESLTRDVVVDFIMTNVVMPKIKSIPWWVLLSDELVETLKAKYGSFVTTVCL